MRGQCAREVLKFAVDERVDIPRQSFAKVGDETLDAPSFLSVGSEPGALLKKGGGQVNLAEVARQVRVEPLPRNGLVNAGVEVRERLDELWQTAGSLGEVGEMMACHVGPLGEIVEDREERLEFRLKFGGTLPCAVRERNWHVRFAQTTQQLA